MIKKILRHIFLFLCPILLIFVFFTMSGLSGLRPLIVLSGSMEPAIHTGSLIFIDTKNKEASPGDIITLDISSAGDGSSLITHRVVRNEEDSITTKGDANKTEDLTNFSRSRVVGTYVFQIPCAGYTIARLRQLLLWEKNKS